MSSSPRSVARAHGVVAGPSVFGSFVVALCLSLGAGSSALAQGADDCASAEPLKSYGTYAFDTNGATTDGAADVLCNFFSNQNIFNDVWFRFTAPETFVVEVSTCAQTTLDSKIAIYGGADCSAPVIACSDDNCSLQTRVSFTATAGETYLVRLGAFGATGFGSGTITIGALPLLGDITDPSTGIRYVAVAGTTWTASEALAVALGGHLVSINDQAEQDFVHGNFGNLGGVDRRIWIGFNDLASEGSWEWTDGSPAKYTNWNGGEPNNSGGVEHYAELLGSNGRWNDINNAGGGFPHLAVVELGSGGGGNPCPADLDLDGVVSASDLATLLNLWDGAAGDLNGDGTVNAQDLAIMLNSWGDCP
ncbi:MAG: hypothetical protein GC172_03555 [Phycisphaera sp.]|nr:hypothetical protein [Phycisphaera sp.]